jgi:hypothetical protein
MEKLMEEWHCRREKWNFEKKGIVKKHLLNEVANVSKIVSLPPEKIIQEYAT